jgi:heterodisulfide reductase subunit C
MHIAKEGFKDDVLGSFTIWLCTSCYACAVKCPQDIKVTDVMYALKRRAIEEGVYPKGFPIPVLAREFSKMVRANGRVSESHLAFRLMLKTSVLRLLSMTKLGVSLLRAGLLSFRKESMKAPGDLAKLLDAVEQQREAP